MFPFFETRWAQSLLDTQNMLGVVHNPVPVFGFGFRRLVAPYLLITCSEEAYHHLKSPILWSPC